LNILLETDMRSKGTVFYTRYTCGFWNCVVSQKLYFIYKILQKISK